MLFAEGVCVFDTSVKIEKAVGSADGLYLFSTVDLSPLEFSLRCKPTSWALSAVARGLDPENFSR